MNGIIAHNIGKNETENTCNYSGVFPSEYRDERERNRGWRKEAQIGNKRGHFPGPVEEFCPEFIFEKTFFGKHDALIVNPEYERKNDNEINIEGKNGQSEPDEVITQVERMPNR